MPARIASSTQNYSPEKENKWVLGCERKEQGKTRERDEESEGPIHSTPRWAMFLFFPFISVKEHTEQKAANADETNQPGHVDSALLFGEEEEKR